MQLSGPSSKRLYTAVITCASFLFLAALVKFQFIYDMDRIPRSALAVDRFFDATLVSWLGRDGAALILVILSVFVPWSADRKIQKERQKKVEQIEQFIELYRPLEPNPNHNNNKPAGFGRRKA